MQYLTKLKFRYKQQQYSDKDFHSHLVQENLIKKKKVIVGVKTWDIIWSAKIRQAFIGHLVMRIILEFIFIVCLYILQTYQTKEKGVSFFIPKWILGQFVSQNHMKSWFIKLINYSEILFEDVLV